VKAYEPILRRGWWAILLALAAACLLLGRHAPEVRVDASTDLLLDEHDPDLAYYEHSRPLWGYDEYAIVFLERPAWIDGEGIAQLTRMVETLRAAPYVARVTSILDVPLLRQQAGPGIDPFAIPTLRSADVDLARAREELLDHTQVADTLVSRDGQAVALLAYVDVPEAVKELTPEYARLREEAGSSPEARRAFERMRPAMEAANAELGRRRRAAVEGVRAASRGWEAEGGRPVRLSGTPIIQANILEHLRHDLRVFGLAAFLLFTLGFVVVYRTPRFVVLPIVTCLLPVALILGAMTLLDMRLTVITANLPVLLFTLMLPYTVYFVERYREHRSLFPDEDAVTATATAARQIWVPCLFSCLTTMAAFAALLTSGTRPVHDFGLMMSAGMAIGLALVFLALPAMSTPLRPLRVLESGIQAGPRKLVRLFASLALRHPRLVVLGAAVTLAVALWGTTRLTAQSKFTEYFKRHSQVHEGLETIDRRMGGTTPLELVLESSRPGYFVTPPGLAALRAAERYFQGVPETGTVRSLSTLVDELRKKNPNVEPLLPLLARHPLVRSVTREFASDDYAVSRILVRMRETAPTLDRDVVLDGLRAHLAAQPELKEVEVRVTGIFLLYANMLDSLVRTQRETFLWVVAAILLMLVLMFRSPLLALIVVLTQTLPAVVILGVMGWFGITLDLVTVMIASLAMGVGIDASIQYTFRFRAELEEGASHADAVERSHATIGRAIWIATTVIIAGFCVLTLSDFRPSIYLGLLTAVAMLMSQLAALTVLPAVFLVTGRPRRRRAPG
jgi:predicted RND superfamily exporter protein